MSVTQGAWMKDPLGIIGAETIFVIENWTGNVLEEFENMGMFKAGIPRKKYKLPYSYDGTGGVVYGPYLYYNRYERCIHQLALSSFVFNQMHFVKKCRS